MKLECYREGVMGFHIGDTIHVSDDTGTRFDSVHFRVVADDDEEKRKAAELAEHERLIALKKQKTEDDASTADSDPDAETE